MGLLLRSFPLFLFSIYSLKEVLVHRSACELQVSVLRSTGNNLASWTAAYKWVMGEQFLKKNGCCQWSNNCCVSFNPQKSNPKGDIKRRDATLNKTSLPSRWLAIFQVKWICGWSTNLQCTVHAAVSRDLQPHSINRNRGKRIFIW